MFCDLILFSARTYYWIKSCTVATFHIYIICANLPLLAFFFIVLLDFKELYYVIGYNSAKSD